MTTNVKIALAIGAVVTLIVIMVVTVIAMFG